MATISSVSWDCANHTTVETGGDGDDADGSDLWPTVESDDGLQYTAFGDGWGFDKSRAAARASYGFCSLNGSFSSFVGTDLLYGPDNPGNGKVHSMISIGGVIYMSFNEQDASTPNVTLRKSTDKFATSISSAIWTMANAGDFLQFILHGADEGDAIDTYAYALQGDWDTQDESYLIRIPRSSIETLGDMEWFTGTPASPSWGSRSSRTAVYSDASASDFSPPIKRVACYIPDLDLYVMSAHRSANAGEWRFYQAPKPWGPYTLIEAYADDTWCSFTGSVNEQLMKWFAPQWIGNLSGDQLTLGMIWSATNAWDRFNAVEGTLTVNVESSTASSSTFSTSTTLSSSTLSTSSTLSLTSSTVSTSSTPSTSTTLSTVTTGSSSTQSTVSSHTPSSASTSSTPSTPSTVSSSTLSTSTTITSQSTATSPSSTLSSTLSTASTGTTASSSSISSPTTLSTDTTLSTETSSTYTLSTPSSTLSSITQARVHPKTATITAFLGATSSSSAEHTASGIRPKSASASPYVGGSHSSSPDAEETSSATSSPTTLSTASTHSTLSTITSDETTTLSTASTQSAASMSTGSTSSTQSTLSTVSCSSASTSTLSISTLSTATSSTDSSSVSNTESSSSALPSLPLQSVDTSLPSGWDGTADATPSNSGELTTALSNVDQSSGIYIIELTAGSTYSGNFTLPNKSGTDWLIIRTSAWASLPSPGTRIDPVTHAALFPIVRTTGASPALNTALAAHNIRLIGIEVTTTVDTQTIVSLGGNPPATSLANMPTDIIIDRCYIHGDSASVLQTRRGVVLNSATSAVVDSYISEIHDTGNDAQAILGYNGPGPFVIRNNFLEGSGENIMFGGGDPSITNLVPSDIEFDGNHFFKPTSWKQGHPDYAGTAWDVKNLFELKNAQRVWMHDNIFENCWPDAQSGYAIVLSPRNADGGAAWSTVEDVLIENNHILNSGSGVSILAQTDVPGRPAENTKRVTIQHNLFESIDSSIYLAAGSSPRCFLMAGKSTLDPAEHVRIIHNTSYHVTRPQTFMTFSSSGPMATDLVVKDNLVSQGNYGIAGDGTVAGKPTLDTYAPGYVFTNNGLVKFQSGDGAPTYPAGNWVISDADAVGYVDHPNGDYHLDTGSPYEDAATDGTDIGADIDALP